MKFKVGDKVRIKTPEELKADGWEPTFHNYGSVVLYSKPGCVLLWPWECGTVVEITDVDNLENLVYCGIEQVSAEAIAEVIPPTLDEYICSLPLEERAKLFVCKDCYNGDDITYRSLIADTWYPTYDDALKATIEALKQPKEQSNEQN